MVEVLWIKQKLTVAHRLETSDVKLNSSSEKNGGSRVMVTICDSHWLMFRYWLCWWKQYKCTPCLIMQQKPSSTGFHQDQDQRIKICASWVWVIRDLLHLTIYAFSKSVFHLTAYPATTMNCLVTARKLICKVCNGTVRTCDQWVWTCQQVPIALRGCLRVFRGLSFISCIIYKE